MTPVWANCGLAVDVVKVDIEKNAYEDYRDGLLSREDFLRYKADYDRQEETLSGQLRACAETQQEDLLEQPWVEQLLRLGHLTQLDRATLAQTVQEIRVFEDKHIEITYLFSDSLRVLLDEPEDAADQEQTNPSESEGKS